MRQERRRGRYPAGFALGYVDNFDGVVGALGLFGSALLALAAHLVGIPPVVYIPERSTVRASALA